jgi:hypothetical protein
MVDIVCVLASTIVNFPLIVINKDFRNRNGMGKPFRYPSCHMSGCCDAIGSLLHLSGWAHAGILSFIVMIGRFVCRNSLYTPHVGDLTILSSCRNSFAYQVTLARDLSRLGNVTRCISAFRNSFTPVWVLVISHVAVLSHPGCLWRVEWRYRYSTGMYQLTIMARIGASHISK